MHELYLILYILAALCFFIVAIGHEWAFRDRVNLLGLGVFFWSLVPLIQTLHTL